jgi:NTE family protein
MGAPLAGARPSLEPAALLAETPLFAGLPPTDLAALGARCRRREVEAGSWFIREGDEDRAIYMLVSGRLRTYAGEQPRREILAGEVFGEISLLSGSRTLSVRAVRHSEVLELPGEAFDEIVRQRPEILHQLAKVVVSRLLAAERPAEVAPPVLVVAVVPLAMSDDLLREVMQSLVEAFGAYGPAVLARLEDAPGEAERSAWAHRLEAANSCVVYEAARSERAWSDWCLRQADRVLVLADAASSPGRAAEGVAAQLAEVAPVTIAQLVLVHRSDTRPPRGTHAWVEAVTPNATGIRCHHLRRRRRADYSRVARLVSGRGCGLVLGGGGARGMAHLGAMRALDELGVPVDAVGGTSIGAVMGAYRALDLDAATRRREADIALVQSGFVFPPTLPVISFSSGRKIRRLVENAAGGAVGLMSAEDCWLPFFCMSASITRAEPVVHNGGSLATAIRASLSLPGLLPPVRLGEDLLLDGGLLNNLPIDVMRAQLGAGPIVAVDLSVDVEMRAPERWVETPTGWSVFARRARSAGRGERPSGLLSTLLRAKELAAVRAERQLSEEHRADLHLRPPVEGTPSFNFRAAVGLEDKAYRYTLAEVEEAGWAQRSW